VALLPLTRRAEPLWSGNAVVRSTLVGGEDCVSEDVHGSNVHH